MVRQVTIKAPKPKDGRYAKSQGTKVLMDGQEVHGVTSVTVRMGVDDNVTAEVELFAWLENVENAEGRFMIRHPFTSEKMEITKLVFGDGTWLKL